jgi:hypothetical protein
MNLLNPSLHSMSKPYAISRQPKVLDLWQLTEQDDHYRIDYTEKFASHRENLRASFQTSRVKN